MNGDLHLVPGERLLWRGRPQGWRSVVRPTDAFLIAFILFAGLFFFTSAATVPTRGGSSGGFPIVAALFPVLFFGTFLIAPRLIAAWREVRGTAYAVTDRRVIISGRRREIELDLGNLQHLELDRPMLGGPTIYFGTRHPYEGWDGIYGGSPAPSFRGLPDAAAVYRLISDARARALQR